MACCRTTPYTTLHSAFTNVESQDTVLLNHQPTSIIPVDKKGDEHVICSLKIIKTISPWHYHILGWYRHPNPFFLRKVFPRRHLSLHGQRRYNLTDLWSQTGEQTPRRHHDSLGIVSCDCFCLQRLKNRVEDVRKVLLYDRIVPASNSAM